MLGKKNYCVYKHTCPNGKVYIGITCRNPIRRWNNGNGYQNNKHFWSAIQKYGWDSIKHEILYSNLSEEDACQKETELIIEYKSNNREYGYNHTNGGNKGYNFSQSQEAIDKMKIAKSGKNNPNYGKLGDKHQRSVPIVQIDVKTKAIVNEFVNIREASEATHIDKSHISHVCSGKRKTAGGFIWMYKENCNKGGY